MSAHLTINFFIMSNTTLKKQQAFSNQEENAHTPFELFQQFISNPKMMQMLLSPKTSEALSVLSEFFQNANAKADENDDAKTNAGVKYVTPQQVEDEVLKNWEVRFNVMTQHPEVRNRKDPEARLKPMSVRAHNSIVRSVQQTYPNCFRSSIDAYLLSEDVPEFHPLRAYLTSLPEWDGRDRVGELAARVSRDDLWQRVFRRWLRGAVKGWLSEQDSMVVFDCQIAPLLVSERQGMGKSTFCRMLLPSCLRSYFTDKFDLTADAKSELYLGKYALINMDEFDRYSERQMATLKNLMQLTEVKVQKGRSQVATQMTRTAAFIGTSNMTELLTDPTGSRRFFCQIVEAPITREPIEHEQLYAQVVAEIRHGEPTFFSHEEEAEIEEHNRSFYRQSPLAEAFHRSFTFAEDDDNAQWVSATEIFETLKRDSRRALQGLKMTGLGRQLRRMGIPKKRTAQGMFYGVKKLEKPAEAEVENVENVEKKFSQSVQCPQSAERNFSQISQIPQILEKEFSQSPQCSQSAEKNFSQISQITQSAEKEFSQSSQSAENNFSQIPQIPQILEKVFSQSAQCPQSAEKNFSQISQITQISENPEESQDTHSKDFTHY